MLATNTLAAIIAGSFPIPGLSQAVRNALRLFIPSPQYCFSDTAGTTPAVRDGNVALWKEATGKPVSASQATAGFQPKLRKGAKNLLTNSVFAGAANPSTLPTNTRLIYPSGVSATITPITANIDGIDRSAVRIRFFGTLTGTGEIGFDYNYAGFNQITAVASQTFAGSSWMRLHAGVLPSGWRTVIAERTAAGTPIANSYTTAPLSSAWQRWQVSRTLTEATTAFITNDNRTNTFGPDTVVDFTVDFAAPMVELGSSSSAYAPTSGSPASNGVGNWWLDFDGVQTRMDFSSVLVTGGAQGFVSLGMDHNPAGAAGLAYPFGQGNLTSTAPLWLGIWRDVTGTTPFRGAFRNDAASSITPEFNTTAKGAYTAVVDSTNTRARFNGSQATSSILVGGAVSINTATVGCIRRNGGYDSFYKGALSVLAIAQMNNPLTEDIAKIEAFVIERLPV